MSQIVTPGKFATIYYQYPFKVLLQINAAMVAYDVHAYTTKGFHNAFQVLFLQKRGV
jgi:hypothetical protein